MSIWGQNPPWRAYCPTTRYVWSELASGRRPPSLLLSLSSPTKVETSRNPGMKWEGFSPQGTPKGTQRHKAKVSGSSTEEGSSSQIMCHHIYCYTHHGRPYWAIERLPLDSYQGSGNGQFLLGEVSDIWFLLESLWLYWTNSKAAPAKSSPNSPFKHLFLGWHSLQTHLCAPEACFLFQDSLGSA